MNKIIGRTQDMDNSVVIVGCGLVEVKEDIGGINEEK